jgi:hypothetical protein
LGGSRSTGRCFNRKKGAWEAPEALGGASTERNELGRLQKHWEVLQQKEKSLKGSRSTGRCFNGISII